MTDDEKAAAFDALALAFTNRWSDGSWSWWCHTPGGGPHRATRAEAVADLVAYAFREAKHLAKRPPLGVGGLGTRIPLDVVP